MTAMDIQKLRPTYALTVEDYVLLSESGALRDFAKTELIEGVIVPVNALYSAHARAQRHFFRELDAACQRLSNGLEAFFEISARISRHSMPRPDVSLARVVPPNGPIERADVALVVEITDTTHDVDLGPKPLLYAEAQVPEFWVVDLRDRLVHRMSLPSPGGYEQCDQIRFGQPVRSATIAGMTVATDDL